MKYKCYHPCVKICHALGIEKQLISTEFLSRISPSTSHYWKQSSVDKDLGSEFAKSIDNNLGDVQVFLDHRVQRTKKSLLLSVVFNLPLSISLVLKSFVLSLKTIGILLLI